MNKKKNSKYDLESKRGSFFLFGLWISFSLIICAFIYSGKTQVSNADWESDLVEFDMEEIEMEEEIKQITPPPPPPPAGMVSKSGEVQRLRLESKGRDFPLGSVPPGVYAVYATFAGFSEFKVATLTVKDGKKYTIHCDATFAACSIK